PRRERWQATWRMLPVVAVFGIVIGGIYIGLYNPTPAAAVGALLVGLYGIGLRLLTDIGLGFRGIRDALLDTATTTAMIYLILLGAEILKIFFARSGLPMLAADAAVASGLPPMAILVLILLAFIVLG